MGLKSAELRETVEWFVALGPVIANRGMRRICRLLVAAATLMVPAHGVALAQAPPGARASDAAKVSDDNVVVTARRREETLKDVPVAITAVSGDELEELGLNSVSDAAGLSPALNIVSDGVGRAFISIRGVGFTLQHTVQPGVGLFVDGVYRPNTAYLNNPLLDVERIEVLRGPQGTLYGKNTLGGAINVITRQPGDELHMRGIASYAGPDDQWLASMSVDGPIVAGLVSGRLAASHREQDGFLRNIVIGGDQSRFEADSINGALVVEPQNATITVSGYYDWIEGVNRSYARVSGPTDYSRDIAYNAHNRTRYTYSGVNARFDTRIAAFNTDVGWLVAYDGRESVTADADADFGPADIVRSSGNDQLDSFTTELRFDTEVSPTLSLLSGLFYSREETSAFTQVRVVAPGVTNTSLAATEGDTWAVFGTLFWRPDMDWEIAFGLRYDREERLSTGAAIVSGAPVPLPTAEITSDEVQPRLSATRHWSPGLMTYATVARGYRGGGFNPPIAPVRTYSSDSVWTYEVGGKWDSADGGLALYGAVFFNDYQDYIGLNSPAPALIGGLVNVDTNTGDVESYGAELETQWRATDAWMISGSYTYVHARITDASAYTAVTGRRLASDRLVFQPDHQFSLTSDYEIPIGADTLVLSASAIGQGERLAATLNQTTPTFLDRYVLVNAQIAFHHGAWQFAVFADNVFGEEYFESYVEQTSLMLAGLPASDLGFMGDDTRIGVRLISRF
jgi:iron complex outermembrane receptor protein